MLLTCQKTAGFTLLEVLIAISIFAVVGLGAYRMLDMVILSQTRVENHSEALRKIERAMQLISADFEQLVDRPVRDNYEDKLPAVIAPQDNFLIEFTRQGWRNPLQLPRSQLQRVAYELGSGNDANSSNHNNGDNGGNGNQLLRHYWQVLDRAQDSKPRTQVLLQNIDDLQIRFLGPEGDWHSEWPATLASDKKTVGLPSAIAFEIHTSALGHIKRLFQLSEMGDVTTPKNNTSKTQRSTLGSEYGYGNNDNEDDY
jgi:general secretion pathway protein J